MLAELYNWLHSSMQLDANELKGAKNIVKQQDLIRYF